MTSWLISFIHSPKKNPSPTDPTYRHHNAIESEVIPIQELGSREDDLVSGSHVG